MIPDSGGDRGVTDASSCAGICVDGFVGGCVDGLAGAPGASWDPGGLGPASTGSFGDFGSFADSTLLLLTCSTQS